MKNITTKIFSLKICTLLVLLLWGYMGFAQSGPTLELSAVDKPQPDLQGATDEVTVRMSQNPDNPSNNTFLSYEPELEVTFSLDNYQIPYSSTGKTDHFGNVITDMDSYGNRPINFGYWQANQLKDDRNNDFWGGAPINPYNTVVTSGFSIQGNNTNFTSANNPTGQGFDRSANYGVQVSILPYAFAGSTANNGSPYPLGGRYYMADLTVTFSRPVNNPILHFAGMGFGAAVLRSEGNTAERRDYSGYHGWTIEYDYIGDPSVSLTKLSGNDHFDLSNNAIVNNKTYIYTNSQFNPAEGSILFTGTGITELKFKVFLRTDPGRNGDGTGAYPNNVGPSYGLLPRAYAAWGEGPNLGGSGNQSKRVAYRTGKALPASISVSLALATVQGTVYNDIDGLPNINGTGANGDGLYVNLLDADGNVVKSVAVASNGSYDLGAVELHSGYQLQLTKNQGEVGNPAPATELNTNWTTVGESFSTTGNDNSPNGILNIDDYNGDITKANITTANFGIQYSLPIGCDNTIFMSSGDPTQLYAFDASVNPMTYGPVGSNSGIAYNAIAVNPIDGHLYGIVYNNSGGAKESELIRITADGTVQQLGPIYQKANPTQKMPTATYTAGEIDEYGNFYIKGYYNNVLQKIDLNSLPYQSEPISLTLNGFNATVNDLAYNPVEKLLYALNENGVLITIDPATGNVQRVSTLGGGQPWGAMFGSADGSIYAARNSGGFYKINTETGERVLVADSPSSNTNDGAHCVTSLITFDADLSVTKTDGVDEYVPGTSTTYTIVVKNNGPFGVMNAKVEDLVPAGIPSENVSYTAVASSGSFTTVSGTQTGAIDDLVGLPVDGTVTYTVTVAIPTDFTGNLVNTVTVTPPLDINDPDMSNNTATDSNSNGNPCNAGTDQVPLSGNTLSNY